MASILLIKPPVVPFPSLLGRESVDEWMLESKGDPLNTGLMEKGEAVGKFCGVLFHSFLG